MNPSGTRLYVANANSNTVSVIDTAGPNSGIYNSDTYNKVIGTITLEDASPIGDLSGIGVAFSLDGTRTYVTNAPTDTVFVIDTAGPESDTYNPDTYNKVLMPIPVGDSPVAVTISSDGSVAYVVNSSPGSPSGTVTMIETKTNTPIETIAVAGNGPASVALSRDGSMAYITNWNSDTISIVSLVPVEAGPDASATISAPDPTLGLVTVTLTASDPNHDPLTVTNTEPLRGQVGVVDNGDGTWTLTYTPTLAARFGANVAPGGDTDSFVVTVRDGGETHVGISPISISPGDFTASEVPQDTGVYTVAVSPDGTVAYGTTPDSVLVIDTATNTVIHTIVVDGAWPTAVAFGPDSEDGSLAYVIATDEGPTNSSSVLIINTADYGTVDAPISLPVGTFPSAVAVSPDGALAYVTTMDASYPNNGSVSVIDTAQHKVIGYPIPVGTSPSAVAFSPDGTLAYVTNRGEYPNSGSVSVIGTKKGAVIDIITAVGPEPTGVAFSPDGSRAYVTNNGAGADYGSVSVIDTASGAVIDTIRGTADAYFREPLAVAFSPDGTLAYVTTRGSVWVVDTATLTFIDTEPGNYTVDPVSIDPASDPTSMAFTPDGRAYVANGGLWEISIAPTTP